MNPSSLQIPRLPIVAAAIGPRMMAHTARHADGWNTMSSLADFDQQLIELADRNERMDRLCAELGRDPSTLRRSANDIGRHAHRVDDRRSLQEVKGDAALRHRVGATFD